MTRSRRVGVIGILGASWLLAVACGADDAKKVAASVGGEAGNAGEGPSAGKSTLGGSATKPGNGGGGADEGGAATAGTGATATKGGAGAGPIGGEGGGGAVPGAAGANPGAGGGDPVAAAKKCDYTCEVDDDCAFADGRYDCVSKRCRPPKECDVAADCVVGTSNWFAGCVDDSECSATAERCVTWQGEGYCARLPDAVAPADPCGAGSLAPTSLPRFGATGDVEVCAELTYLCNSLGVCSQGCGSTGCGVGTGDTCNVTTGACECAASSECTAPFTGLDTCVSGTCGCETAASCRDGGFANTVTVCE